MCPFLCNLIDSFVSLLFEPIARKNVSPSDKILWQFLKNVLVAEKLQCKEISLLLLMSAENTKMLNLKLCFFGFVHRHNELFFHYL